MVSPHQTMSSLKAAVVFHLPVLTQSLALQVQNKRVKQYVKLGGCVFFTHVGKLKVLESGLDVAQVTQPLGLSPHISRMEPEILFTS